MLNAVLTISMRLSRWFDHWFRYPPRSVAVLDAIDVRDRFLGSNRIADVGGGKKPFSVAAELDVGHREYVGMDIDPVELERSPPNIYSGIRVLDVRRPPADVEGAFDLIICRHVLEHVDDATAALAGLCSMLRPGGCCYVKVPCRKAVFARLNQLIPQRVKLRLLHALFPSKQGDGFPAFYDRGTPAELGCAGIAAGLRVVAERRHYRSSYFGIVFPLYVLWRLVAAAQYRFDPDYCESFELVFERPGSD